MKTDVGGVGGGGGGGRGVGSSAKDLHSDLILYSLQPMFCRVAAIKMPHRTAS